MQISQSNFIVLDQINHFRIIHFYLHAHEFHTFTLNWTNEPVFLLATRHAKTVHSVEVADDEDHSVRWVLNVCFDAFQVLVVVAGESDLAVEFQLVDASGAYFQVDYRVFGFWSEGGFWKMEKNGENGKK